MEFDRSVDQDDIDASGLGAAQDSFGPSGFSSDQGDGTSAEDFNSFVTDLNKQQAYTIGRGATAYNPYPDSIFSRIFGAENVDYTNILGSQGVASVNKLRFDQAMNPSQFKMGDFYVGQPTFEEGIVKETPRSGIMGLVENIPYLSTVTNLFGRNRGLPEGSDRFKELTEQAKENEFSMEPLTNLIKDGLGIFSSNTGQKAMNEMANNVDMNNRTFDMFGDRLDTKQIDDFSQDEAEIPNFMTNPIRKIPMVETNFFQART